jgi:hypothetical protein
VFRLGSEVEVNQPRQLLLNATAKVESLEGANNLGYGLLCLTPHSTIFKRHRGGQFHWWRKPEYPAKNHPPVACHCHTLSHHIVSSTPHLSGIRTHSVSGDKHLL